jgi:single-strand DNA-binding protein
VYQHLTIIGNLGKDPEMRYLPDGRPVTTMSVATNRTYTDQSGQQVKEATWFRVSVFGKAAEACAQYLHKGSQVFVEGRLRPDPQTGSPKIWTRQDGSAGASFEITATTVKFLGGRGTGGGEAAAGSGPVPEEYEGVPDTSGLDDIPF